MAYQHRATADPLRHRFLSLSCLKNVHIQTENSLLEGKIWHSEKNWVRHDHKICHPGYPLSSGHPLFFLQGEALYVTPISLINFYIIPPRFRVMFIGSSQLVWGMFLSAVQHELPDITKLWVSAVFIIIIQMPKLSFFCLRRYVTVDSAASEHSPMQPVPYDRNFMLP